MKKNTILLLLMSTWLISKAFAWCLLSYSFIWTLFASEDLSSYILSGLGLLVVSWVSENLMHKFM